MNSIIDLVGDLQKKKIKLSVEQGNLVIEGKKELITADIRSEIKKHKQEIIRFLNTIKKDDYKPIANIEKKAHYAVSSAQKRLYVLNRMDEKSTNYNSSNSFEIEGNLVKERLKEAFVNLIKRHESLRTSFEMIEDEIVQKIADAVEFHIEYEEAEEKEIIRIQDDFVKPFDLSKAPLLRVKVVYIGAGRHIMLLDMHHIITDGTSTVILVDEFLKLYNKEPLGPMRIQYKDYSEWERKRKETGAYKKMEEYWSHLYEGETPLLNLPLDYCRPVIQSFEGHRINFVIGKELTEKLKEIMKNNNVSLYMLMLAGYNILLAKYSGQENIVVGSPIEGRSHAELRPLIGMFVNTLAMRNRPEGNKCIRDFLREVKENALKAYENQEYPFEELVEKVHVKRDTGRNPLFNVMFVLQNMERKWIDLEGLKVKLYKTENKTSKFDLKMEGFDWGEEIEINFEYCTKLFRQDTIERMSWHYEKILTEMADDPNQRISSIEMITREEQERICEVFNNTKSEYPQDKTIVELFEEQAEKKPDNIAVVCEDKRITYRELNEKGNQLARLLRRKGVVADSIVGIMVDRSIEMVIGIMGILKAGGAYLPIDPEYPDKRIQFMLDDSRAKVMLAKSIYKENRNSRIDTIFLDDDNTFSSDEYNVIRQSNPGNLVYIIYTSGSTGSPKGVMIENRQLVNYVTGISKRIEQYQIKSFAMVSIPATDMSNTVIYASLCFGGCLYILSRETILNEMKLKEYIINNSIDCLKFVPSHLSCLKITENSEFISALKLLILAGESSSIDWIKSLLNFSPKHGIMNSYGPTESTVGVATFCATNDIINKYALKLPIGKPLNNIKIHILDAEKKCVPIGIPGELYISGDSLARGYLNRPELTGEKFVENPFEAGGRMYRTGDLARWLPDGNIEFWGRIDDQVKVNGFRIELGEIERQLLKVKGIRQGAVVAKEDKEGNKYICAYYTGDNDIPVSEFRKELSIFLPEYMLPAYYVKMERIPLAVNGKLDRKALPDPAGQINTGIEYEAPRDEMERKLAGLWQNVLDVEKVGINDNFFDLGGNSLKLIKIMKKTGEIVGRDIKIIELFQYTTINKIIGFVRNGEKNDIDSDILYEKAKIKLYTTIDIMRRKNG